MEDDESVSAYAKRKQIQAICQSEKKSQKQCIETKKKINKTSVNYSKMAELLVDENSCQTQYYKGWCILGRSWGSSICCLTYT